MKPLTLLFATIAAAQTFTSHGSPDADQLSSYLERKRSPLQANSTSFVEEGRKWNVDSRLIVAIAGAESTFGKNLCAANNAWNWFHRRSCPPSTFNSYEEGIGTVTKFMQRSYLRRGYTTIPLIRTKYCASGCEHWVPNVTRFYSEMPTGTAPPPDISRTQPLPAPQPSSAGGLPRPFGMPLPVVLLALAAIFGFWLFQSMKRRPPSRRRG